MNRLSRKRLVDRLMDAYVTWREACLRVSDAYISWASGANPDATLAFGVYMATLDREERAAEVYAGLVRSAAKLCRDESDLATVPVHRARGVGHR